MSLSRKNYEAVAEIVADQSAYFADLSEHPANVDLVIGGQRATSEIATALASYFAADNPNFDRARFLAACNVEA